MQMNNFGQKHEKVIYIVLSFLAISAIGLATYIFSLDSSNNSYTELYFKDHRELPTKIETNSEYEFTFALSNKEGRKMNYQYQIISGQDFDKRVIKEDTVELENESSTVIDNKLVINADSDTKITVQLKNPDQ